MAELLLRVGSPDRALLGGLMLGAVPPPALPDRVVVDAHVAASTDALSAIARTAGVPFMVDPQTHYLQDRQHSADAWSLLTFATPAALTPADLGPARQQQLIEQALAFQLEHGATQLIVPGVHIEGSDDGWTQVQLGLLRRARRYLDRERIRLPVSAPIHLSWRLLAMPVWEQALEPLRRAALELGAAELLLAAGKSDKGVRPDDRLADLIAVIAHLRRDLPVVAWQQGTLGEACVAGGAAGYECGIGWRETCDLRGASAGHRSAPATDPPLGRRPVYVHRLRRSLPARSVEALSAYPRLRALLTCPDYDCCPDGASTLLGDARHHAVLARARSMQTLSLIQRQSWRWASLATDTEQGLLLAERINRLAGTNTAVNRVDTGALRAIHDQALVRRRSRRRLAA